MNENNPNSFEHKKLIKFEKWFQHPSAEPHLSKDSERFIICANGTRTCAGGWRLYYNDISARQLYKFEVEVEFENIENIRDNLECIIFWEDLLPESNTQTTTNLWNYLKYKPFGNNKLIFYNTLVAPEGVTNLTIQFSFRWTSKGKSKWQLPQIIETNNNIIDKKVDICVVTGQVKDRLNKIKNIDDNVNFYSNLCKKACEKYPTDLIVLPEIALQWELPGHHLDHAVPLIGTETAVFADIAKQYKTRILLGMLERDGDAVYNTAALFSNTGILEGKYHKVHLATGEDATGILPGDSFPVFDTEIGKIGCNICMDSSVAESSRMVGLKGADFLLLPIMGDHRASLWHPGTPKLNLSRWKAIMRTRALDNQLTMLVARNMSEGSCIIDRKGDIIAWNNGNEDFIHASVNCNDGYRTWDGGCFRELNWIQRRPHLYSEFVKSNY